MAKGKNRPRGGDRASQRDTRFTQRAQSNVELQDQSQVNLLQQQLQDAQRDYLRERQAAQSVWGGGGEAIRDMPRPQFDRIGQEFNQAAGSYADLFGGAAGMPASEVGAGNALGLAYGDATHGMLANLDAREGLARSSAARQMDLAGRYTQDNVIQRMEDAIRGYNDQLGQVRSDDPWQVQNEIDRLREQAITQKLAQSKIKSDAATAEWLQNYLGGGQPPGGGRPPGGNQQPSGGQPPAASAVDAARNNPNRGMGGRNVYQTNAESWAAGNTPWGELGRPARRYIRRHDLQRTPPPVPYPVAQQAPGPVTLPDLPSFDFIGYGG